MVRFSQYPSLISLGLSLTPSVIRSIGQQSEVAALSEPLVNCDIQHFFVSNCHQRPYLSSRFNRGPFGPRVRLFQAEDYEAVTDIHNQVYHDNTVNATTLRQSDGLRPAHINHQRWVAEVDDKIVGVCGYTQRDFESESRQLAFNIFVHPDYQSQGIGRALYKQLTNAVQGLRPFVLRSSVTELQKHAIAFLQSRGFTEEVRSWMSRLDLSLSDASLKEGLEAKLQATSIDIKCLSELCADVDLDTNLLSLWNQLLLDVPMPEGVKPLTMEDFAQRVLQAKCLLPEAFLVAVHEGRYIGISCLFARPDKSELYNDMTGVLKDFRGKGIATALKLRNVEYAKLNGYSSIRTINMSINRPILSLNDKLGFKRGPAHISFVKDFSG